MQGVPLEQLKFKRVLFGAFPCYPGASPLPPAFDRVLQIGDAAAGQSPLSFGGFGSMVRGPVQFHDRDFEGVQQRV
jgi:lycopene cyclase CruP